MDYILNLKINSTLGILLYWLPLIFCGMGYFLRTYRNYQKDKAQRIKPGEPWYVPTDKIGTLIGRGLISIIPIANLCAAVFDVAPEFFSKFFERLEDIFNTPLVPDSESAKAKRKSS